MCVPPSLTVSSR